MASASVAIKRLFAAFLLLGALYAPATGQGTQDAQVLELFAAAAFGPNPTRKSAGLFKWDTPVRVRLVGRAPDSYRGWAEAHVLRLTQLTDHDIQLVSDISADVLIYFVPRFQDVMDGEYNAILRRYIANPEQIEAILRGYRLSMAICGGQVNAAGSTLKEAIVFIPVDHLPTVGHNCLVTQVTRVMGLPFPVPEGAASVFSVDSPYSHLTAIDERLIRLLYDRRMQPGMTRNEALAIAATILDED